jgi:hypothetical protein
MQHISLSLIDKALAVMAAAKSAASVTVGAAPATGFAALVSEALTDEPAGAGPAVPTQATPTVPVPPRAVTTATARLVNGIAKAGQTAAADDVQAPVAPLPVVPPRRSEVSLASETLPVERPAGTPKPVPTAPHRSDGVGEAKPAGVDELAAETGWAHPGAAVAPPPVPLPAEHPAARSVARPAPKGGVALPSAAPDADHHGAPSTAPEERAGRTEGSEQHAEPAVPSGVVPQALPWAQPAPAARHAAPVQAATPAMAQRPEAVPAAAVSAVVAQPAKPPDGPAPAGELRPVRQAATPVASDTIGPAMAPTAMAADEDSGRSRPASAFAPAPAPVVPPAAPPGDAAVVPAAQQASPPLVDAPAVRRDGLVEQLPAPATAPTPAEPPDRAVRATPAAIIATIATTPPAADAAPPPVRTTPAKTDDSPAPRPADSPAARAPDAAAVPVPFTPAPLASAAIPRRPAIDGPAVTVSDAKPVPHSVGGAETPKLEATAPLATQPSDAVSPRVEPVVAAVQAAVPAAAPAPAERTAALPPGAAERVVTPPVEQLGTILVASTRTQAGNQQLTVRLDPPELGRVHIAIAQPRTGAAAVTLTVERPDTLLLVLRDAPALHRALDRAGVPAEARTVAFELAPQREATPQQPHAQGSHSGLTIDLAARDQGQRPTRQMPARNEPGASNENTDQSTEQQPAYTRVWQRAGIDITA